MGRFKIAFFDVDGTLLSFKTHAMPASTRRALAELRGNGVLTVVASGRSFHELPAELQSGFDAYITLNGQKCFCANGQNCYCGADVYRRAPIDPDDVRAVVGQVDQGLYDVGVQLEDRTFASGSSPAVDAASKVMNIAYAPDDIHIALGQPVYQFLLFAGEDIEQLLLKAAPHVLTSRWTDAFCDVGPVEGGKDYGVRATLERFGLTKDEAIAFGDGENDLSMLSAVGTGVAMGNASDVVKAQAAYVTDDVDDDGLWNACRHFGLV